jgi:hypothetical protein
VLLRRHWQSLILDNEQDAEVNEYRGDLLYCRKTIGDEQISRKFSRRVVSPAWIAGVLISRPNFNPM